MHAFNKGRAKDPRIHALLVKLFNLQLEQGFWRSLKWVPTHENATADAVSRPSRQAMVRMRPRAFRRVWETFGELNVDLMQLRNRHRSSHQGHPYQEPTCHSSPSTSVRVPQGLMFWHRTCLKYRGLHSRHSGTASPSRSLRDT